MKMTNFLDYGNTEFLENLDVIFFRKIDIINKP